MDINMDARNKDEYEFLDLSDLDESIKDEIIAILKSNTAMEVLKLPWDTGETEYFLNSAVTEFPEEQSQWQQYEMDEGMLKYGGHADTSSSILVSTIPSTSLYSPQIMYSDQPIWSANVCVNSGHVHPFMTGMAFSPQVYTTGNDIHDIPPNRGSGRRSGRGRGVKRDMYNRGINLSNEMQSGYMGDQGQYQQIAPMYHQAMFCAPPDHSQSQQHPAMGPPIYLSSALYSSSAIHPHSHTLAHPGYSPNYHSQGSLQHMRQSQTTSSYSNQESTKNSTTKSHDKRMQNAYATTKPSFRQTVEEPKSSEPSNIATVIVNNSKLEPCVNNIDESTTNKNQLNNNKKVPPVNLKTDIVSTVNENYEGVEKSDVPCININTSIEVKQNTENDKEFENETVSRIKITVVKTVPKSASKVNDDDVQNEESNTIKKLEDDVPTHNSSDLVPVACTSPVSVSSKSWASILKKEHTEINSKPANNKPTARINPLNVNGTVEPVLSPKVPMQVTPKNQQDAFMPKHEVPMKAVDSQLNDCKLMLKETAQDRFNNPVSYRLGEFLLKYQMDKQTVSLLPRGLTNRSNYCYINSILQALLACPPFYNLLMAVPHSKNSLKNSSTPLIDNMVKFAHEFTPLSDGARLARRDRVHKRSEDSVVDIQCGVAFEPSYVYTMLKNTSSAGVFSVEGRQEDAEEFLSCLLNGISDEMLELMKLVNNNQNTVDNQNTVGINVNHNSQGEQEEWKVMGPKNRGSITRCTEFGRTPLSDIFRGQLRSRVSRAGEQPTDNVQPFFTLQLDIEKAESVKGALEILVGKDQLEGMTCSRTKQQIEAWKQVTLEELPVILILHLKWFDYKLDGCSKIFKSVEFPVDLKIDSKFLSPNAIKKLNAKQKQYKLFAVTYHDGKEATKGHYVTDAFHVGYGGWVRYDDSSLKGVSENNVLNPSPPRVPYLLYYRRCDTIGNNQPSSGKHVK